MATLDVRLLKFPYMLVVFYSMYVLLFSYFFIYVFFLPLVYVKSYTINELGKKISVS